MLDKPVISPYFSYGKLMSYEFIGGVTKDRDKFRFKFKLIYSSGNTYQMQQGGYKTRNEAEKAKELIIHDLIEGTFCPFSFTLKELLEYWLYVHMIEENQISYNTFYSYRNVIYNHILKDMDGGLKIRKITIKKLQNVILNIESDGIRKRVMHVLRSSLSFAYQKHYIDFNPSLAAISVTKKIKPVHTKKREVFWSIDLIRLVLKTCKQNYSELFMPLLLSLMIGTRISETIALKYADVDFTNKSILIMRQLGNYFDHETKEKVKGEILPKTDHGVREIPVPDWVLEEIIVSRGCYEKNRLRIPGFEDYDYICCKINGKPFHRRSLSRDFSQLMSMCGIHDIHWHDLRHIYASTLKNNEINIKAVSTYMGHGNSEFTEKVYISNTERAYDCTILERVWTFVKPIDKIEENLMKIPLQDISKSLLM